MNSKKNRKRVVVKLGSGLLTDRQGQIDLPQIESIGRQVASAKKMGWDVILVSSGAISAGMTALGLQKRPKELKMLQVCATIGQPRLIEAYQRVFSPLGLLAAQILVTNWDFDSRKLYANTQATVEELLRLGHCVPIFNENDALSFDEILMLINTFGDNDHLSAQVASLSGADCLIILSSIDGLMTRADGKGKLIRKVSAIDKRIESYAGQTQSQRSVGGMVSKLKTAKLMLEEGIKMVIANGRAEDVIVRVLKGDPVGTTFEA